MNSAALIRTLMKTIDVNINKKSVLTYNRQKNKKIKHNDI